MSKNDYFMQLQADILGINVERHSTEQVTSLGIAYLAGLAVGYWEDEAEIKKLKKRGTVFIPNNDNTEIRSEEHTSELQSRGHLVCRLLLEKKKKYKIKKERYEVE